MCRFICAVLFCAATLHITDAGADVIGLGDYGIAVGREASFVALHAPNAAAVATVPYERIVVRKGEIFAAPGACKNS